MFDANAAHISVGEKFFAEVHSVNPQLVKMGVVRGDIILCEHVVVGEAPYGGKSNVLTKIWTQQDNHIRHYNYDDSSMEKPFGWLVYSGRPNGKGFISDMWKQKALDFLGGKWDD